MTGAHNSDIRWYVCHTKPRCEKRFADLMASNELQYYLPLYQSARKYFNRRLKRIETKNFTKPLFPSYVFCRLPLERKADAYHRDYVVRLIAVEDEVRFLKQIHAIRQMIEAGVELEVCQPLRKGLRVRVTRGPLMGVEGVVDDPDSPRGIVVAVDILRQGVLTEIDRENLEIIED